MSMERVRHLGAVASIAAVTVMVGAVVWASAEIPEGSVIPLHWNLDGVADRFGDRGDALGGLALMPAITVVVCAVFWAMTRAEPKKGGLEASAKAFLMTWIAMLIVMLVVTLGMAVQMVGNAGTPDMSSEGFLRLVMVAVSGMLVVLGNYLPKTRPNFTIGVRTRWTLTSAVTWQKTHRLAGVLFMLAGLTGLAAATLLDARMLVIANIVPVLAAAAISTGYSWWVWRNAPDVAG
ncbi:MAG: SdpI family protein [Hyphomonadaceae bacterium]|jgi:uncharacterized membrane protein|nr:SdpI family protein [Hyphomonadaceae bacterium]